MAVSFAPVRLELPAGIEQLLSDFTKEVLRSQPSNINAFGAEYFKTLVLKRKAEEAVASKPQTANTDAPQKITREQTVIASRPTSAKPPPSRPASGRPSRPVSVKQASSRPASGKDQPPAESAQLNPNGSSRPTSSKLHVSEGPVTTNTNVDAPADPINESAEDPHEHGGDESHHEPSANDDGSASQLPDTQPNNGEAVEEPASDPQEAGEAADDSSSAQNEHIQLESGLAEESDPTSEQTDAAQIDGAETTAADPADAAEPEEAAAEEGAIEATEAAAEDGAIDATEPATGAEGGAEGVEGGATNDEAPAEAADEPAPEQTEDAGADQGEGSLHGDEDGAQQDVTSGDADVVA